MKSLLVVNDLSCIGKVALSNIIPVSNCLGITTSSLPTVLLSSHTGFKNFFKKNLTDEMLHILNHFKSLHLAFDCIITGYFYDEAQIELFLNQLPSTHYLVVDPIMADNGRLYSSFSTHYPISMRKLCAKADLIIPNISEACLLLNKPYQAHFTKQELLDLIDGLRALGSQNVIITSVSTQNGKIGVIYYFNGHYGLYETERFDSIVVGSGDLFSGIITSLILNNIDFEFAIKFSVDFIAKCIQNSSNLHYGIEFESHLHLLTSLISKGKHYE